jgi:hypothetical protein
MVDFARTQNFDSDFDLYENFSYDQEISVLISEIDLFGDSSPLDSIYIGSAGESEKYIGLRLETELYVGSGNLWP